MDKIFAVYKPKGPTSYDVIREIKNKLGKNIKIGHAGTLDPLASGILVIGLGDATKRLGDEVKKEKEYITKIKLGEKSTTDDGEGEKILNQSCRIPKQSEIQNILEKFVGKINQIPPRYSALKIGGQPAYKRVRRGEVLEMKSREVEIKNIEFISYEWPYLELKVVTGPGVYIRALARDIGEELGTWGYMTELERIRVGDFRKENAVTIEEINKP